MTVGRYIICVVNYQNHKKVQWINLFIAFCSFECYVWGSYLTASYPCWNFCVHCKWYHVLIFRVHRICNDLILNGKSVTKYNMYASQGKCFSYISLVNMLIIHYSWLNQLESIHQKVYVIPVSLPKLNFIWKSLGIFVDFSRCLSTRERNNTFMPNLQTISYVHGHKKSTWVDLKSNSLFPPSTKVLCIYTQRLVNGLLKSNIMQSHVNWFRIEAIRKKI